MSMPRSRANRRASGVARREAEAPSSTPMVSGACIGGGPASRSIEAGIVSPGAASTRASASSFALGVEVPALPSPSPAESIQAMMLPTGSGTSSATLRSRITPEAGASTSIAAFSVSISKIGWPLATDAPSPTYQREMRPSVMSMSTRGRMTSVGMCAIRACRGRDRALRR
jgi:hypothetical protein